jgi:Cu/Ag efflux pump CusA
VLHEGAQRLQTVTANVAGGDVASFIQAAKPKIATEVELPAGTYLQFAGAAEAQSQSRRDLISNSLIAGAGIILLLSIVTCNWRNLTLILANLPFALVGGVLAVFARLHSFRGRTSASAADTDKVQRRVALWSSGALAPK